MGKRTNISDITVMALLYRRRSVGTTMLSYDRINEFDRIINQNLDAMQSTCSRNLRYSYEVNSETYHNGLSENGTNYAILVPNVNLDKSWERHINRLPIDVITASQMENALSVIGLKIINHDFVPTYFSEIPKLKRELKK